jgi:molybdopterin molybdotransferase
MIAVDKALQIVMEKVKTIERVEFIELDSASGRVLAEDIFSDIDIPPFNRASMDGYAVTSDDLKSPPVELDIIEEIPAGHFPKKKILKGASAKIMTGAPVPEGADAVVMVEDTELLNNGRVKISSNVRIGENISPKGEDVKKGDKLLKKGVLLRPQEVSMLATVGKYKIKVLSQPLVSILATGTELVEPDKVPSPGQIRNSNSYSLLAQCQSLGINPEYLGIAKDDEADLREKIKRGLDSDLLIISGGISMGDYDFVPSVLREYGVRIEFEKVAIKPGKPVLFGTREKTIVFGLPGNPVSTMVIYDIFVRPVLKKMMGDSARFNFTGKAKIEKDFKRKKAERQEYIPVKITRSGMEAWAAPVKFNGSADMMALTGANGLLIVPVGINKLNNGDVCDVVWFSSSDPSYTPS